MPKITQLDRQWEELMSLCKREEDMRAEGTHPKLLKVVSRGIDDLAAQMGFSARRTRTREFRSEKSDGHIIGIVRD
jgi:hypothetical protein